MKPGEFVVSILVMLAPTARAESWFCTAEKSTGFAPTEGVWEQVSVRVEDQKFVLRELTEEEEKSLEIPPEFIDFLRQEFLTSEENDALGELDPIPTYTHLVTRHGEEDWSYMCVFRPLSKRFICDGLRDQSRFVFKQETGRFVVSHLGADGYLKEKDYVEYANL